MCICCIYNSMNVCKWCMSGSATENSILLSVLLRLNKIFNQSIKLGCWSLCGYDHWSWRWHDTWQYSISNATTGIEPVTLCFWGTIRSNHSTNVDSTKTRVSISWLYPCNKSSYIRFAYSQYHVDWAKCKQSKSHTSLAT